MEGSAHDLSGEYSTDDDLHLNELYDNITKNRLETLVISKRLNPARFRRSLQVHRLQFGDNSRIRACIIKGLFSPEYYQFIHAVLDDIVGQLTMIREFSWELATNLYMQLSQSLESILMRLLPRLCQLTKLHLGVLLGRGDGDGVPSFALLSELFSGAKELESLSLTRLQAASADTNDVDFLVKAALQCPKLAQLNLGIQGFSHKPLLSNATLASLLDSEISSLRSICLHIFGINDEQLTVIADILERQEQSVKLEHLDLLFNWGVTESGVSHLLRIMETQYTLKSVQLVATLPAVDNYGSTTYDQMLAAIRPNLVQLQTSINMFAQLNRAGRQPGMGRKTFIKLLEIAKDDTNATLSLVRQIPYWIH